MIKERVLVITGGSDGIGAAAARQIRQAQPGARLAIVGRSAEKTATTAREVEAEAHFVADYARLDDVRRVASEIRDTFDHIDVLANNAGAIFGDRSVTTDGNEKTFQVNLLAPFLLTHLLLDRLQAGDGAVINTSSVSARLIGRIEIDDLNHESGYTPMRAYGDAKLGNILFTRGLHERYHAVGIRAVAFDPGNVRTSFGKENNNIMTRLMYRTPLSRLALISSAKGGENLAYFLTGTPGIDWHSGEFYTQQKPATARQTNKQVHDQTLVNRFWDASAFLAGLPR